MAALPRSPEHPRVHLRTAAEWSRWLRTHHATQRGAWLVAYRATTGKARITYEDSVVEALRYGWIDSVQKPVDDERTATLFTPRRWGSGWSGSNKVRVARLIDEGLMTPAGLAAVEAAKRDGSWTLLDSVEALEVPADLRRALGRAGMRRFDALPPGQRKERLRALVTAKRPETRAKRVALIAAELRGADPAPSSYSRPSWA